MLEDFVYGLIFGGFVMFIMRWTYDAIRNKRQENQEEYEQEEYAE